MKRGYQFAKNQRQFFLSKYGAGKPISDHDFAIVFTAVLNGLKFKTRPWRVLECFEARVFTIL